jgi:hydroxyacylglutathione hydrolase
MLFRQILEEKLAQYAYLIGCQQTKEAVLIDPQRDIERYVALARAEGLTIIAVAETHIHADFLSGCREFAARHGVKVYLPGETPPDWTYRWTAEYDVKRLRHGDTFRIGNIELRAVHTPGHTPEHTSYLVTDRGGGADQPMGVATGDFVFVGDLGRPDLLETAAGVTGAMEPSARQLYRSAVGFLDLPDWLQVWPGHGAGSACGKALGAVPETTVGYERRFSPALAAVNAGEQPFVDFILAGQPEPPPYFARMKALNRDGPPLLGEMPRPAHVAVEKLAELALRDDVSVVDARRDRAAFMAGHLRGSIFAPLNKTFPTIVGSYVNPEQPVYLIVPEEKLHEAVLDLVRIGYDHAAGYATPADLADWAAAGGALATTSVIDFDTMDDRRDTHSVHVLDVRGAAEYAEANVPEAQNIAHTRLALRLAEVPRDRVVAVHCESGARAASATSLLERQGYDVALVDDRFDHWQAAHARA